MDTVAASALDDRLHSLPNNIQIVRTVAGDVLVNSPPETLKYLLAHGLQVPQIVLLPPDIPPGRQLNSSGFVRNGINYASVEFLIYSTFFASGERLRIITVTDDQARRLRTVLADTISGPATDAYTPANTWLRSECAAVGYYPPLGRAPQIDDMAELLSLEAGGGKLGDLEIVLADDEFLFREHGREVARLSTQTPQKPLPLAVAPPRPLQRQELTLQFIGGSDGFDPSGITTCFLAYLGATASRPVLFDAAAYVSVRLGNLGLSPNQVSAVVLSHLHEDHMAGLPELLLSGGSRVRLLTSTLIYRSLLRVFAALLALPESEVATLFDFLPLDPGRPIEFDGLQFQSIYAVHSIPTIAVRAGQLCYSGDMRYDENWFAELVDEGVLTDERRMQLQQFAEGAGILVQDAGGGPIHSTLTAELLAALSAKSERIVFAHTNRHHLPNAGDTVAKRVEFADSGHIVGLGDAVAINASSAIVETLSACPLFSRLTVAERGQLASHVTLCTIQAGEAFARQGEATSDQAYVVHTGLVEVWIDGELRQVLGRGHSLGERGVLRNGPRTATLATRGDVQLLCIAGDTFRVLAKQLELDAAFERADRLQLMPAFAHLPWATLLDLALDFEVRNLKSGEQLFTQGEPGYEAYIILAGALIVCETDEHETDETRPRIIEQAGEFFGGRAALFGSLRTATVRARQDSELWVLPALVLQRLHILYPGLVLHLRAIESGRNAAV
jgi:CRP-like cAMP-binding protein/ribonuclease BN (tRNA processing enzyme)